MATNLSDEKLIEIFRGKVEDLPKKQSKIVSIFLSSTFSDFHEERDYLIENVYTRLKNYCKNQYGLDFQVLDMRWGVQGYGRKLNFGSAMCIDEVKRCNQNLANPCFIAILSHRYGQAYLQSKIQVDEFLKIRQMMNNDELEVTFEKGEYKFYTDNIIDFAYKLDENIQPPSYNLLAFGDMIPDYEIDVEGKRTLWKVISDKLTNLIQNAAIKAAKNGLITQAQKNQYFFSVTENEIINGILNASDIQDRTLVFVRTIENIEEIATIESENKNIDLIKQFIDYDDKNKSVDIAIKSRLDELKFKKLPQIYGTSANENISMYNVKWSNEEGISRKRHAQYMKKFGDDFFDRIRKLVDKDQISKKILKQNSPEDEALFEEILTHASFCYETASKFHFREELINQVESYISSNNNDPLVIHGSSGCGKSSLIAKVVHKIRMNEDFKNSTIILRFLGTTPATSKISSVYKSIAHQLNKIYKIKQSDIYYRDYNDFQMMGVLRSYLFTIHKKYPNERVLIFLDSVDQLNKNDYHLEWILKKYPSNTKFVYSVLSDYSDILKNFETNIVTNKENYVFVGMLDYEHSLDIIKFYLNKSFRKLTDSQLDTVKSLFQQPDVKLYPLYVKLVFDIVSSWNSYTLPSDRFLNCKTIDDCVAYIFEMMEENYGKMVVSRCLFYLTASDENGISNVELEDVLSLDDELLFEIFLFRTPPIRRFPITLWNRIKSHLNEYITLKEVDETQVYFWYHRRFIEVARQRYVNILDSKIRDKLYLNLLDVFNETWKDEPKPFKYDKIILRKKTDMVLESEARRYTSQNPIKYVRSDGNERYNMRRLNKVLELSLKIQDIHMRSKITIENIFLNYEFLYGIFKRYFNAMDYTLTINYVKEIEEFFIKGSQETNNHELDYLVPISTLIQVICLFNMSTLNNYADSVGLQMCSRLLGLYGICDIITKFIDTCDKMALKHCALVAPYQMQPLSNLKIRVLHNFFKPLRANQYLKIRSDYTPDFFLCGKTIYLWIWAPESHKKSEHVGEISLPDIDSEYVFMKVYKFFHENTFALLVASKRDVLHIDENGKEKWRLSIGYNETIKHVFLIGDKAFILIYENRSYFDIFKLFDKTQIERKSFDSKILFSKTNHSIKSAWSSKGYKEDLYLSIGLEDSTLIIYQILCDFNQVVDNANNNVLINYKTIFMRRFSQYQILSGTFEILKRRSTFSNNLGLKFRYIATFTGLRCVFIEYDDNLCLHVKGLKALYHDINENYELKILYYKRNIVVMQYGNKLHLCYLGKMQWFCIPGTYSYVTINSLDGYLIICAHYGNILNVFLVQFNDKNYKILHLVKSLQLSDDIFDTGIISGGKLLIMLKSGMILDLSIRSVIIAQHQEEKFDRSIRNIDHMMMFDQETIVTYSDKKGIFNGWNYETGKIVFTIDTGFKKIHDFVIFNNTIFVFHVLHNNLIAKIYTRKSVKDSKNEIQFNEEQILDIGDSHHRFKLNWNKLDNKLIILSLINEKKFKIKQLEFNKQLKKWQVNSKVNILEIENYFDDCLKISLLNRNNNFYSFTANNNYLVLIVNKSIKYINARNQDIISEKELPQLSINDKTTSESGNDVESSLSIKRIPNTDDLLIIFNKQKLIYITFDNDFYTMNVIEKNYQSIIIDDLKLVNHLLCFKAIKTSENLIELMIYDLNLIKKYSSFDANSDILLLKERFEINNNSQIKLYDVTPDLKYLFIYRLNRSLALFNLKTRVCIANVPIYTKVLHLSCTNSFIILSLDDKRIISYLIADQSSGDIDYQIKQLESRRKDRVISSKDLDECYNCMLQITGEDNDYNWTSLFEPHLETTTSLSNGLTITENDVFKQLAHNIKLTHGKCIDQQFDAAIKSLHKRVEIHTWIKVEDKNEDEINKIVAENKTSVLCSLI